VDVDVVAPLLLRVVVGGTMVAHGLNHWLGGGRIAGTARWFGGLGLRYGKLQAWLSVLTEVGAGGLLVLGLLTPFACAAVISVMLVAGVLAHRPHGFFVFRDGYEYVLVLAVTSLVLAMLGPGRLSVDHADGTEVTGWAGAGIAFGVAAVATAGLLAVCWRPARSPAAQPEPPAAVPPNAVPPNAESPAAVPPTAVPSAAEPS
jgi:putative oxidoreductase